MTSKYVRDIRRIVGIDVAQSSLGPDGEKSNVNGSRGIAFMNGDGSVSGANSTPGSSIPNNPNGNSNLGTTLPGGSNNAHVDGAYGQNDDSHTAKDLIDGAAGTPTVSGGGRLTAMTGMTDCETGKDLDIRFDGASIPPSGWTTDNTPPVGTTWPQILLFTPGIYYVCATCTGIDPGPTIYSMLTQMSASPDSGTLEAYITAIVPVTGGFAVTTTTPAFGSISRNFIATVCTLGTTGCPITAPVNKWPADGKLQLIKSASGQLIPDPHEPDADLIPKYSAGNHASAVFCFDGGRKGFVTPTADGGKIVGEIDPDTANDARPDFIGTVRVYDTNGRLKVNTNNDGAQQYFPTVSP